MPSSTQEMHVPNDTFTKEVKKLYAGPISLILFITGIAYLASLALSFLVEAENIFLPLKSILGGLLSADQAWSSLLYTVSSGVFIRFNSEAL